MTSAFMYILIGIVIGWVTKVPFLGAHYRKLQREKRKPFNCPSCGDVIQFGIPESLIRKIKKSKLFKSS